MHVPCVWRDSVRQAVASANHKPIGDIPIGRRFWHLLLYGDFGGAYLFIHFLIRYGLSFLGLAKKPLVLVFFINLWLLLQLKKVE